MPSIKITRENWRFGARILAPLAVVALLGIVLAAFGLFWTTSRSDEISVERQVRTTRHAIGLSVAELAKEQQTVAAWDQLIVTLAQPQPDLDWVDTEVGVWLYDLFGHDQVYILDANDRPVYAMVDGKHADPARFGKAAPGLAPFLDAVRGRSDHANGLHDRLPGRPAAARSMVLTSEDMVHDSGLAEVQGRPAAASVMKIVPLTDAARVVPGREHVLVSVRFLDGGFLSDLSARSLIDAPRFSQSPATGEGEFVLPLASHHGARIGYFFWSPELPGTRLLSALGPLTAVSVLLMTGVMAWLARSLWRSMHKLHAAMIELQASEAQAQHLAFHDTLTGLPNRAMLNDRLDHALARARRGEQVSVLALDLDRFKQVNDTHGHHAGDLLIAEVANRLTEIVRETDTVARLGGDEFAIILSGCRPAEVEGICERILAALREPFSLLGNPAFIGVSIGVVHVTETVTDRIDVLRKADIALYRTKAEGRDAFNVFTREMDETVRLRGTIEDELRIALATGEGLQVHYQPQVGRNGEGIIGLEALVRWQHPQRGMITPGQFIPIAEESGLICQLGEWVLHQACAASRRWPDLFIAVNLSPVQFRTAGFAERLVEIVQRSGAEPSKIELEVTESVFLAGDDFVRQALNTLRASGIRIALDDFGTGYSSLSYLRRFDIDKIKIDRSFVQYADQDTDSAAIVNAVVTLGHAMGLSVVAEGVETPEQQEFLSVAGCNGMQGYLFSRPVPEEAIAALLKTPAKGLSIA